MSEQKSQNQELSISIANMALIFMLLAWITPAIGSNFLGYQVFVVGIVGLLVGFGIPTLANFTFLYAYFSLIRNKKPIVSILLTIVLMSLSIPIIFHIKDTNIGWGFIFWLLSGWLLLLSLQIRDAKNQKLLMNKYIISILSFLIAINIIGYVQYPYLNSRDKKELDSIFIIFNIRFLDYNPNFHKTP